MAKRRKSFVLSPAQRRVLLRLKKQTDAAYRNYWIKALGIQPPRPPKIEPFLVQLGKSVDYIARILPPPKPPF